MDLLPLDLVVKHIIPALDFTSRIRLAAVSKLWRSLSRLAPHPAIADMPWTIGFSGPLQIPSLLNLNDGFPNPTTHLPRPPKRPEVSGMWFWVAGVVDGQAILTSTNAIDGTCVTLYSPFSGETRRIIPQPTGLPSGRLRIDLVRILSESGLVVVTDYSKNLFVSRLGHFDWVGLKLDRVSDFIFYNGELFCVGYVGRIYAFNVQQLLDHPTNIKPQLVNVRGYFSRIRPASFSSTPSDLGRSITNREPDLGSPLPARPKYYYDSEIYNLIKCEGELLLVTRFKLKSPDEDILMTVVVEKMNFGEQKVSLNSRHVPLVSVSNLGNASLFVKEVCSESWSGIEKEPSNFFTKNCVYFIEHLKNDTNNTEGYYFGKFSLEEVKMNSKFVVFHSYKINSNMPPFWMCPPLNSLSS